MKKNIALYFALLIVVFAGFSCSDDEDNNIQTSPYAYISSFTLGNLSVPFHDVTADDKDTIVYKTVAGSEYKFVVDHNNHVIYNKDSLTYGTDVSKLTTSLSYKGVPYIYSNEAEDFVYYYSVDSIDFTSPVKVRVRSTDATYDNDYIVKVNVHQVDPDLMVWAESASDALADITPLRLVEKGGVLYLFGDKEGEAVVATATADALPLSWRIKSANAPASADFASLQLLGNLFCVAAEGNLYVSDNAIAWENILPGENIVSLIGVCPEIYADANMGRDMLVAATADKLLYIADAVYDADGSYHAHSEPLPEGFPVYNTTYTTSPLATNANIYRSLVVGYPDKEAASGVQVWGKLSNEQEWSAYTAPDSKYPCPSLNNLAVLPYDGALYAFGGSAGEGDDAIAAFGNFFVSHDNGIAWRKNNNYAVKLPATLLGQNVPFAAAVVDGKYMWIVTPQGAWRGFINRLGF